MKNYKDDEGKDTTDLVNAYHKWQLNVPINYHIMPFDVWEEAWQKSAEYHLETINNMSQEMDRLTDFIDSLTIDLAIKNNRIQDGKDKE
jgi:hypothetical protein